MTEKRFYYNTFYFSDDSDGSKEFEIRDSENDEWVIYINENDSNWEDMLIELLNEQDELNQKLINSIKKQYCELTRHMLKCHEYEDWESFVNWKFIRKYIINICDECGINIGEFYD